MTDPRPQSAASAARRATDDPNLFVIPSAALPAGFAETLDDPARQPVEARPAATVVLLRDAGGGLEVLLLRRHKRSGFAAGAWVFPGGVVDERDRDAELLDRLDGPTPGEWARRLGMVDAGEALGYVAAAIREAFEETGILLAHPDPDSTQPRDASEGLEVARRALLNEVVDLRSVLVGNGRRLSGGELIYIAHWITPLPEPRRYDTRFFAAHVPAGAECTVHDGEMTDFLWLTPADAVSRFEAGEMKLLPPTVHTLRRLARYGSWEQMRAWLQDAPVPSITPRMQHHPDGVAIVVPE
ncbi:MAG TPA: NUDIX domain-containing protein [Longimicrobium sp.]